MNPALRFASCGLRLLSLGAVMGSVVSSRSIATGFSVVLSVLAANNFGQIAHAQFNSAGAGSGYCWIDAKTGEPVNTYPQGTTEGLNPNERSRPSHVNQDGSVTPGRDFVRVPCPQTQTAASTGLYLGGELAKNWGLVRSTEKDAITGDVTSQFSGRGDPVGGGVIVGYKFAPWANNVVVSPFASFDFIHAPVNTFPGVGFLGTTANFVGTVGVKIGPQLDMGLWLYGIAGVSVLNETLNVNFAVTSSQSATVPGATVGVGGAVQPAFLQGFGRPVSLFLEYQHSWWQDATFNTPAAVPGSNFTFRRDDDVLKFGFTVSLSPPPPPPPIIRK